MKPAIQHSSDERAAIYRSILAEEKGRIVPQATGITGGQIAAAKARATKRFFAMGF